ncbi:hypothetical protein BV898_10912 [Hypsibius exemplaris]|uniref:Glycosyltransferase family 92 protein n=1 Tax=Hypsibius exemplaris TaxID=2072580 RepID=A0A1W0WI41_HYPEX|nr:hypothetical protein BV898_10912 [Hypsibius exemplaris]
MIRISRIQCGSIRLVTAFYFGILLNLSAVSCRQFTRTPDSRSHKACVSSSGHHYPNLTQSSILRPERPPPRSRIVICAMIRNEQAYLLEWIEFHRLQGVDQFILYDDGSTDDADLIPLLYQAVGLPGTVKVLSSNFLRHSQTSQHTRDQHDANQRSVLHHCHRRFGPRTNWMLLTDIDEFTYSPRFPSLSAFLRRAGHVKYYFIKAVKYGTNGRSETPKSNFVLDVGKTDIFEAGGWPDLVLDQSTTRAPRREFEDGFDALYSDICMNKSFKEKHCGEGGEKALFRPLTCRFGFVGIHGCDWFRIRGAVNETWPLSNLSDVRIDHYYFRSPELVKSLPPFAQHKLTQWELLDRSWFSLVHDDLAARKYAAIVRASLGRFNVPHFD